MEQGHNLVGQFYRNHFITSIQCHAQVGAFVHRNAVKSFKTKHLTKVAQTSFEAPLMACSFFCLSYYVDTKFMLPHPRKFILYIHFINNSELNKQTGVAPSVVFYLIIIIFMSFC